MKEKSEWVLCPVCGSKTRIRIGEDTVLIKFPLFCPKCRNECLINAEKLNITVIDRAGRIDAEPTNRTQGL